MFKRIVSLGLLGLLMASASAQEKPAVTNSADLEAFFDGAMRSVMESKHIAGGVVAVVAEGKVVFTKGYGYADVAARRAVDPEKTLFQIASISKPFTWTAVMQQVEAGKLDLNADVNQYLKGVQIPAMGEKPITLKNLLTHTPGFEDHVIGLFAREPDTRPLGEILKARLPARVRAPGTLASYSNHGTALAGHAVESVSNLKWEDYIEQKITKPLGMTHTLVRQLPKDQLPADQSKGYLWQGGQYVDKGFEYCPISPAGCISSSAGDMSKFMLAHLGDGQLGDVHILKAETARQMREPLFRPDDSLTAMCYGFFEEKHNGLRLIGHGGDTLNFHSLLQLIPEKKLGFFISFNTNTSGGVRGSIQSAFLDRYFPVKFPARVKADAGFAERAGKIAGEYRNTRYSYTTFAKGGALLESASVSINSDDTITLERGENARRMVEVKPFHFRELDGTSEVVFQTDQEGNVVTMLANNAPHSSNVKLKWYETTMVYLGVLAGSLLLMLTSLLVWPAVGWSLRGTTHPTVKRSAISGFFSVLGWLLALGGIVLCVAMVIIMADPTDVVYGISPGLNLVLLSPQVIAGLAGLTALGAIIAWLAGYWTLGGRVHYTLVALAGGGLVWFLWQWNLLTWGMQVQQ